MAPAVGAWSATAGCTLLSPRASLGVAALTVPALAVGWRRRSWLAGLAAGVLLGALVSAWHVHSLRHGVVPMLARRHASVELIARLVRDPLPVTTTSGARLTVVDATVTAVQSGTWSAASSPVVILSYGAKGWAGLLPGQQVDLTARLAPPRRSDSVAAVVDARGPPRPVGRPPWWQRAAGQVRTALRGATSGLPADARGLLPGLVVGDVSAMPAGLLADMRVAGLTHLEAVSGENVSVVLSVTMGIAGALGLRRRPRVAVGAAMLAGFVVLARPSPSVLRAAVMGTVILLGMATGRRSTTLPALAAAVLLLVVVNPFLARAVGFVLSVLATWAITTWAPRWIERLSDHLPRPLAAALAVPAAAQLACTPVLVLTFGTLTPYAVPANVLAAPAVAPATALGLLVALVAAGSTTAAVPLGWLAVPPAAAIAGVAHAVADLPAAGVRWSLDAAATLLAVVALAAVLASRLRRRRREILGE